MTTIISLSHDTNNLPKLVSNWDEMKESTKEFILNASDFRIMNSQEMLIYNGRQILASCSIDILENNQIFIENCWTNEGNIF